MKELHVLTTWLVSQRGNWTAIAKRADVSTKTIERIVKDPEYNVTRKTIQKLDAERRASRQKQPIAA